MGGTIRAAINLAGYLADRYDVEIISHLPAQRASPTSRSTRGVKVVALDDQRKGARRAACGRCAGCCAGFSSALYHPADIRKHNHNLWTDVQLVRHLRGARGIAIASRPGHIIQLADLAAARPDHGRARADEPALARQEPAQGDAPPLRQARRARRAHRAGPRGVRARARTAPPRRCGGCPNTVRAIEPPRADLGAKRIFAAGRYTPQKGYDFLIHAWAPVAAQAPGLGAEDLRQRPVEVARCRRGSRRRASASRPTLAGPTDDVPGEMAQASIYALSLALRGLPARAGGGDEQGHGVRRLRLPDRARPTSSTTTATACWCRPRTSRA